jgi:hypothetical protein
VEPFENGCGFSLRVHRAGKPMTGNAKIYCGEQRLLDLATRRLVRFIFWSWW